MEFTVGFRKTGPSPRDVEPFTVPHHEGIVEHLKDLSRRYFGAYLRGGCDELRVSFSLDGKLNGSGDIGPGPVHAAIVPLAKEGARQLSKLLKELSKVPVEDLANEVIERTLPALPFVIQPDWIQFIPPQNHTHGEPVEPDWRIRELTRGNGPSTYEIRVNGACQHSPMHAWFNQELSSRVTSAIMMHQFASGNSPAEA